MKNKFKSSILAAVLFFTTCCSAQKFVQTKADVKKLQTYEKQFIGKPLKVLLNEIEPKIETAIARSSNSSQASFFNFYFTPKNEYNRFRKQNKFPLTIKVYIKGSFVWDKKGKNSDEWLKWTKEDELQFGDLIVEGIKVYNDK